MYEYNVFMPKCQEYMIKIEMKTRPLVFSSNGNKVLINYFREFIIVSYEFVKKSRRQLQTIKKQIIQILNIIYKDICDKNEGYIFTR